MCMSCLQMSMNIQTYVTCTYAACLYACMHVCMHACMRMCMRVCVHARTRACIHPICTKLGMHAHLHTYTTINYTRTTRLPEARAEARVERREAARGGVLLLDGCLPLDLWLLPPRCNRCRHRSIWRSGEQHSETSVQRKQRLKTKHSAGTGCG